MATSSTPITSSSTPHPCYEHSITSLTAREPTEAAHALESLRNNANLTSLTFCSNAFTGGLQGLAQALTSNRTLTSLSLLNCACLNDKRETEQLAQAIKDNPNLTSLQLSLRSNQILRALSDALGPLAIEPLTPMLTDGPLTSLDLSECNLRDHEAGLLALALTTNSTLKSLNLGSNRIGESGIEQLMQAATINSTLTHLTLRKNDFTDNGLRQIALALRTNSTIESLDLAAYGITDGDGINDLTQALATNSTLTLLDLSFNYIDTGGLEQLALALKVNSSLSILKMCATNFGTWQPGLDDVGAGLLFDSFTHNTTLTTLNLAMNHIGKGPTAAEKLALALTVNSSITELILESNDIRDGGLTPLALALTTNSTLTHLDLSRNNIRSAGANQLLQALTVNTALSRLSLTANMVDDAREGLAGLIRSNTTLTTLDLLASISPDHFGDVVDAYRMNSTLMDLNLAPSDNKLFGRRALRHNQHNDECRNLSLEKLIHRSFQKEAFNRMPQDLKNQVYWQIWKLLDFPLEDSLFGEKHVFDDWSMFCTALELAGITLH
ncbi:MAG: hypothetical protein V4492_06320 [Chlamydiota bacterium]